MRKAFAALDDVLIERLFQPVATLICDRIGLSRRTSACLCIDFASLCWIVSRVPHMSDAVAARDTSSGLLDLTFLLLGLVALVSLRTLLRRTRDKPANPLRTAMQPHRAIALTMLAARLLQIPDRGLAEAADIAMLMFATTALYLAACAEQPPLRRIAGQVTAVPT